MFFPFLLFSLPLAALSSSASSLPIASDHSSNTDISAIKARAVATDNEIPFPIPSTTTTLYITSGRSLPQPGIDKLLTEAQRFITIQSASKSLLAVIGDFWHGTHFSIRGSMALFAVMRIDTPTEGELTLGLTRDIVRGLQLFYKEEEARGHKIVFRYVDVRGTTRVEGKGDVMGSMRN
ncbi:MAG: hypothetical protein Q9166_006008 [cf. Caloplaca sp. 2 TL-2023]